MTRIAWFDPGMTGAIALIDTKTKHAEVHDMPIMSLYSRKTPNPYVLGELLEELKPDVVGIEWVVPMPRKRGPNGKIYNTGMASTGDFMYGAGALFGLAAALKFETTFVTPAEWKRFFKLLGKTKEASRSLALRKFPKLSSMLKRKKDEGRAEALLMAHWYAQTVR